MERQHMNATSTRISPSAHRCAGAGHVARLPRAYRQPTWNWGEGADLSPSEARENCAFVGTGSGLWDGQRVPSGSIGIGGMFFSRFQSTALSSTVMLLIISLMRIVTATSKI